MRHDFGRFLASRCAHKRSTRHAAAHTLQNPPTPRTTFSVPPLDRPRLGRPSRSWKARHNSARSTCVACDYVGPCDSRSAVGQGVSLRDSGRPPALDLHLLVCVSIFSKIISWSRHRRLRHAQSLAALACKERRGREGAKTAERGGGAGSNTINARRRGRPQALARSRASASDLTVHARLHARVQKSARRAGASALCFTQTADRPSLQHAVHKHQPALHSRPAAKHAQ